MRKIIALIPFIILFASCSDSFKEVRDVVNLEGTWQFVLDEKGEISESDIIAINFTDSVTLPGSLDENKKGRMNTDTSDLYLNRRYVHIGPAYFKKQILIPEKWIGKAIRLVMERTKVTNVWLDNTWLGTNNNIYSKQEYELPENITAGNHTLVIKVDNNPSLVPVEGAHAYSENTQTNWNGIVGDFLLEASNPLHITDIRVTPDVNSKTANLLIAVSDKSSGDLSVKLMAESWNRGHSSKSPVSEQKLSSFTSDGHYQLMYEIGENMQTWSEFNPVLYKMHVNLLDAEGNVVDYQSVSFGMREFSTDGQQFTINGTKTFLRGKHDACVFPLTGYPPMDKEEWIRLMKISQSYGLNHYRFHTWTPPKAAFEAADICGIYMQAELPAWYGFNEKDSSHIAFLLKEGYEIMDNYANHASFVMFSLGNELHQERDTLKMMVVKLRAYDFRPLFAQGSNNRLWDPSYAEGDDFWVSFRTDAQRDDLSSDIRTSISHLDSKEGGILNTLYPSTTYNFSKAIEESPVPVVGFEVGQYSIYPDYNEMKKYTGILDPRNFQLFRNRLEKAGMLDQSDDFFKASGALSVICYRADIEAALRTPDFGGFHLLDLQDFPGQGTALVGMLDAFMDSKGLIDPNDFKHFCNEVTLLAELKKYCWTTSETFSADIVVPNYSISDMDNQELVWKLQSRDGKQIAIGEFKNVILKQGEVNKVGTISASLDDIVNAQKLNLEISISGKELTNNYPVWVYPSKVTVSEEDIIVVSVLDKTVRSKLENGAKVLLMPDLKSIEDVSEANQFISEFWNWGMFTSLAKQFGRGVSPGTMGLLMDAEHPIFHYFPTDFHTNWQWWSIIKNSRSFILDGTDKAYRPVVQIIDNINRNHKLGLIFEFKLGEGKLLICTSTLKNMDKPEAKQLYYSMVEYMKSDDFKPENTINTTVLNSFLQN